MRHSGKRYGRCWKKNSMCYWEDCRGSCVLSQISVKVRCRHIKRGDWGSRGVLFMWYRNVGGRGQGRGLVIAVEHRAAEEWEYEKQQVTRDNKDMNQINWQEFVKNSRKLGMGASEAVAPIPTY